MVEEEGDLEVEPEAEGRWSSSDWEMLVSSEIMFLATACNTKTKTSVEERWRRRREGKERLTFSFAIHVLLVFVLLLLTSSSTSGLLLHDLVLSDSELEEGLPVDEKERSTLGREVSVLLSAANPGEGREEGTVSSFPPGLLLLPLDVHLRACAREDQKAYSLKLKCYRK